MTDGITGSARDGRLPAIRLNPVKDGLIRDRSEIGTTATQRDWLGTEQARRAKKKEGVTFGPQHVQRLDGDVFVETKGKITRRIRTLDMADDEILPGLPKVIQAAAATRSAAAARVAAKATGKAPKVKGTPRDYSAQDKIIRSSGYKGEITSEMRKVAGDVIAFRRSLL
jgi:hypothetical protein